MTRISILLIAIIASTLCAFAQSAEGIVGSINSSGSVYVDQPQALGAMLKKVAASAGDETERHHVGDQRSQGHSRTGYRVQVYDDNNPRTGRHNAEAYNARVAAQFPHLRTYLSFNSPYWRVKAGDFRTRAEAESALAQIRSAFPALSAYLRIVRDHINLTD